MLINITAGGKTGLAVGVKTENRKLIPIIELNNSTGLDEVTISGVKIKKVKTYTFKTWKQFWIDNRL